MQACVNSVAWAPHSACHICTCGDDRQALIWDLRWDDRPQTAPSRHIHLLRAGISLCRALAASHRAKRVPLLLPACSVLPNAVESPILAYTAEAEVRHGAKQGEQEWGSSPSSSHRYMRACEGRCRQPRTASNTPPHDERMTVAPILLLCRHAPPKQVNQLEWFQQSAERNWVAIAFNNKMQILRV